MSEAHIQCTERCLALEAERDALQTKVNLYNRDCAVYVRGEPIVPVPACTVHAEQRDALREQVRMLEYCIENASRWLLNAQAALEATKDTP